MTRPTPTEADAMTSNTTPTEVAACPFCGDPMKINMSDMIEHTEQTKGCPIRQNAWPAPIYLTAWNQRASLTPATDEGQGWQDIATFDEPTASSSGCGVLVAEADGTVGEAYFRAFGDDDDGWWWANTSWGDYPEPQRPAPVAWMPLPPAPKDRADD